MSTHGIGLGSLIGPAVNSSGQSYVIYEDASVPTVLGPRVSPAGFSVAVATGAGDFTLKAKSTAVPAEDLGAVPGDRHVVATLANATGNYLLPGTISIPGGTPLKDNGQGLIITVGSNLRRGTVNYATHELDFTYFPADKLPAGNVLVDYAYSDLPDSSDPPETFQVSNLSVSGAAGDVTFTIWNNEAKTVPLYSGVVTVVGGVGTHIMPHEALSILAEIDPAKRNCRWVTVDIACEFYMFWQQL
jgi:hypothetical protein